NKPNPVAPPAPLPPGRATPPAAPAVPPPAPEVKDHLPPPVENAVAPAPAPPPAPPPPPAAEAPIPAPAPAVALPNESTPPPAPAAPEAKGPSHDETKNLLRQQVEESNKPNAPAGALSSDPAAAAVQEKTPEDKPKAAAAPALVEGAGTAVVPPAVP